MFFTCIWLRSGANFAYARASLCRHFDWKKRSGSRLRELLLRFDPGFVCSATRIWATDGGLVHEWWKVLGVWPWRAEPTGKSAIGQVGKPAAPLVGQSAIPES